MVIKICIFLKISSKLNNNILRESILMININLNEVNFKIVLVVFISLDNKTKIILIVNYSVIHMKN